MLRLSYDPHVRIRTANTVSVVAKKLAWNDIKDLPESHGRTEIVDGELVISPTPGLSHQRICSLLGAHIARFVEEHNLGEFLTALSMSSWPSMSTTSPISVSSAASEAISSVMFSSKALLT